MMCRWIPRSCLDPIGVALFRYLRQERQHWWFQLRHHAIQGRGFSRCQQRSCKSSLRFDSSHDTVSFLLTCSQDVARDHMEKIKQEFPWISYGDLWTLGGVCAIQESGGPTIPWRPGRIDGFEHHVTPDGRLPDAAQAQDHLRFIFNRMGFNDQEIVALSGAHAMGRCHTDRSGFDGPWQFSPTTFSNEYFRLLYVHIRASLGRPSR